MAMAIAYTVIERGEQACYEDLYIFGNFNLLGDATAKLLLTTHHPIVTTIIGYLVERCWDFHSIGTDMVSNVSSV